jgi:hypothetical protein
MLFAGRVGLDGGIEEAPNGLTGEVGIVGQIALQLVEVDYEVLIKAGRVEHGLVNVCGARIRAGYVVCSDEIVHLVHYSVSRDSVSSGERGLDSEPSLKFAKRPLGIEFGHTTAKCNVGCLDELPDDLGKFASQILTVTSMVADGLAHLFDGGVGEKEENIEGAVILKRNSPILKSSTNCFGILL